MTRTCILFARLCSAMWVGAALLFVLTSVTEQVEPAFETVTRDRLALIRFPWYYGTGAVLLTVATIASGLVCRGRRIISIAAAILLAAIGVMAIDFVFVYRPLRASLTPPGIARTPEFHNLHQWSEWLNTAGFLLTSAAALLLCAAEDRPLSRRE